jgi:hypothetical protein
MAIRTNRGGRAAVIARTTLSQSTLPLLELVSGEKTLGLYSCAKISVIRITLWWRRASITNGSFWTTGGLLSHAISPCTERDLCLCSIKQASGAFCLRD